MPFLLFFANRLLDRCNVIKTGFQKFYKVIAIKIAFIYWFYPILPKRLKKSANDFALNYEGVLTFAVSTF